MFRPLCSFSCSVRQNTVVQLIWLKTFFPPIIKYKLISTGVQQPLCGYYQGKIYILIRRNLFNLKFNVIQKNNSGTGNKSSTPDCTTQRNKPFMCSRYCTLCSSKQTYFCIALLYLHVDANIVSWCDSRASDELIWAKISCAGFKIEDMCLSRVLTCKWFIT